MRRYCINMQGRLLEWSSPLVMGILNITPDSFSDSTHLLSESSILSAARCHLSAGADILDIGGYSTRPGAAEVTAAEEWRRVSMALRVIRREWPEAVVSVDTFRADVAEKAIDAFGPIIINDVSGGEMDAAIFQVAARTGAPYILTHMRGTPATMQSLTDYTDLMSEIVAYFEQKITALRRLGVKDIILDPGFGFAKTTEQNYTLLRRMHELEVFDLPILAGISHKSMIYKPLGITPQETLNGTTALHMVALQNGASILRVHDVKEAKQVITLHALCQQ